MSDKFGDECESCMEGGSSENSNSFMGYMFSMDDTEKAELLNLIQYICLAIIPLIIMIKFLHIYMPKYNEYKGNVEVLIEVILYLVIVTILFWFINKFIMYIPTYSKVKYENINILNMILPFLFLVFTLETNLKNKIMLLANRMMTYLGFTESMTDYDNEERIETQPAIKPQQAINLNMDYSPPENTRKENIVQTPKNNSFVMEPSYQQNNVMNQEEPVAANTFTSF